MKKKIVRIFSVVAICSMLSSCEVLNSVAEQVNGLANLSNCEYKFKDVSNLTIGGVNVKNLSNGKVTATDVVKLSSALLSKKVPMAMDVNINVKNPTDQNAALTAMDWILDIDGSQFANGVNTSSYTIAKKTTTTVPLNVNTDLYSKFSSSGLESLKNFIGSFSSDGTSSKVGLRIKPSLNVAGVSVPSPNYITLQTTTGNRNPQPR